MPLQKKEQEQDSNARTHDRRPKTSNKTGGGKGASKKTAAPNPGRTTGSAHREHSHKAETQ